MATSDFLPRPEAEFSAWFENFVAALPPIAATIGLAPSVVAAQAANQSNWVAAVLASAQAEQAALAANQSKRDTRTLCTTDIRSAVRMIQANPLTTDTMRVALGLSVGGGGTGNIVPQDVPVIVEVEQQILEHEVHYRNLPSVNSRARPGWAKGANLYLKIDGPAPSGTSEMSLVKFVAKSPYHHEFGPTDVGKKAWWVVVWTDGVETSAPSEAFGATITG